MLMTTTWKLRTLPLAAIALMTLAGMQDAAQSQSYPSRPVRMVVAFAAGGPTDALARLVADKLGEKLGQRVVVENRAGAGGNIGYETVAKSAPDGYTLAFADPSITVNPSLYASLKFDVERDFVPISLAVRGPTVMVVPAANEAKTLGEFIALARKNPGKLTYGSAGSGTPPHLNAEFFKVAQQLEIVHVPYKGAAPAIIDLVAGRIDLMFLNIGSAKGQIQGGKLRGLAVSGAQRAATLPEVPTFREAGFPLPQLDPGTWWGVIAPVGLPPDIAQKLNAAMQAALNDPALRERLAALNVDPTPSSSADFANLIKSETKKWAEVVKRAKITIE
jgi:tripartite-type tricarboxylate transporter receptor subunit TctC